MKLLRISGVLPNLRVLSQHCHSNLGAQWPKETRVLQGLLDKSLGSRQLCLNPVWLAVADHFLSTTTTFWWGDEQKTCVSKPLIHLTSSFQTVPGARRQGTPFLIWANLGLHRDD